VQVINVVAHHKEVHMLSAGLVFQQLAPSLQQKTQLRSLGFIQRREAVDMPARLYQERTEIGL
jgi:hypothetical protein